MICYSDVINFANDVLARKDPYNHHGKNVAELCLKIAGKIQMTSLELQLLDYAAQLHDVGKILLDDVLLNYPRKLTDSEYLRMQSHAVLGHTIISSLDYAVEIREAVYSHHEHWDGSGYPRKLHGEQIPLFARIICIADTWDSMTNNRVYRPAMTREAALAEMNASVSWFDPKLYEIFLNVLAHA